ncbi:MAG: hypothetical protein S4CHLAM2_16400 [Chlamydiales bacterium]|nr:hypothetical protein [Chlamydiales bacterium]
MEDSIMGAAAGASDPSTVVAQGPRVQVTRQGLAVWASNNRGKVAAVAIPATILATVLALGIALVAYMHFGGLGFNSGGFAQLGKNIVGLGQQAKSFLTTTHPTALWKLITISLGTLAGTGLLGLAATKGPKAAKACKNKAAQRANQIHQYRADRREARAARNASAAPAATTAVRAPIQAAAAPKATPRQNYIEQAVRAQWY